jgi:hypothetical protein
VHHPPLHISDPPAGVALVPASIELLRGRPELYNQIARKVLRVCLAALLTPKADHGRLVVTHDNAGIGAADEGTTVNELPSFC